jgi:hypothetical protein
VRVEARQRLGVFLHTPDGRVGFHDGDVSPVQGDGLAIHKGTYTYSETPFERIVPGDRFFGGSVEYELLPAAAAAAPAGERRPPPQTPLPRPRSPRVVSGSYPSPPGKRSGQKLTQNSCSANTQS